MSRLKDEALSIRTSADIKELLRLALDASVCQQVVPGLIFLRFVPDASEELQRELREQFRSPEHDHRMAQRTMPMTTKAHAAEGSV